MKKIEPGHHVFFGVPPRRRPIAFPMEGIVYKIKPWPGENGKGLYSIYVKRLDSISFGVISCFGLEYRDHWEHRDTVTPEVLAGIQETMKCMEGVPAPSDKKRKVKRPIEIRKDAVLQPNRNYGRKYEIYVQTKKKYYTLIRTTAKMAFFKGGRCSINNVTDIRRIV